MESSGPIKTFEAGEDKQVWLRTQIINLAHRITEDEKLRSAIVTMCVSHPEYRLYFDDEDKAEDVFGILYEVSGVCSALQKKNIPITIGIFETVFALSQSDVVFPQRHIDDFLIFITKMGISDDMTIQDILEKKRQWLPGRLKLINGMRRQLGLPDLPKQPKIH